MNEQAERSDEAAKLLAWYDRAARNLPWRARPGEVSSPYRVWLSEIMLQQTTVATVSGRFEAFLARWPTVEALAAAPLDDVLHEWQGLGYYARARNLHKAARVVANGLGGHFPETEEGLRRLPGVGDYTAAAIAAIAYNLRTAPVDGNIIRVVARLRAVGDAMPAGKVVIREHVAELIPNDRPGDFAQAMMDLGATVCTPRTPNCGSCPWHDLCRAAAEGQQTAYPVKKSKPPRLTRHGVVFWLRDDAGRVAVRRRPESGLLGGMIEFPSTEWRDEPWATADVLASVETGEQFVRLAGSVGHTFTHFHLELDVVTGIVGAEKLPAGWRTVHPEMFVDEALPTVMKKVARFVAGQPQPDQSS